ncbi:fluoride efflux transporter CrcB [bacterium]|nr:fluoride efflux transporter CrcB [bacterium]
MIKILMVGLGGFTGSICRYLTAELSNKFFNDPFVPYGTIIVNVAGCFFIGFLGGLCETKQIFTQEVRAFILVGFLGGFTTFSTFGYEIFTITKNGQYTAAITHLMIHLVLGFGAVWLGFSMHKFL